MGIFKYVKDRVEGKAPAGAKRSPKWSKVRAEHLLANPTCAVCGGKKKLEVHHKVPFHIDPTLELEPTNLITLCESKKGGITCHLAIGHLGNYRRVNLDVTVDVAYWSERLKKYEAPTVENSSSNEIEKSEVKKE